MAVLKFDVMVGDKYKCTLQYQYSPLFPFTNKDIQTFVEEQRPYLKGQKFHVEFCNQTANMTQQPKGVRY